MARGDGIDYTIVQSLNQTINETCTGQIVDWVTQWPSRSIAKKDMILPTFPHWLKGIKVRLAYNLLMYQMPS